LSGVLVLLQVNPDLTGGYAGDACYAGSAQSSISTVAVCVCVCLSARLSLSLSLSLSVCARACVRACVRVWREKVWRERAAERAQCQGNMDGRTHTQEGATERAGETVREPPPRLFRAAGVFWRGEYCQRPGIADCQCPGIASVLASIGENLFFV